MHMADGKNALEHIGLFFGVGLVDHTHITLAGGAGFVGVNARHNDQTVCGALLHGHQAGDVVHDGVLIVGAAGTDQHKELVAFAGDDFFDFGVARLLALDQLRRQGKLVPDDVGGGQLGNKGHSHNF